MVKVETEWGFSQELTQLSVVQVVTLPPELFVYQFPMCFILGWNEVLESNYAHFGKLQSNN